MAHFVAHRSRLALCAKEAVIASVTTAPSEARRQSLLRGGVRRDERIAAEGNIGPIAAPERASVVPPPFFRRRSHVEEGSKGRGSPGA